MSLWDLWVTYGLSFGRGQVKFHRMIVRCHCVCKVCVRTLALRDSCTAASGRSQRWKMPKLWRAHWASGVLRLWLRWSCNTPSIGCLHENGRLPLRTKNPQNSTNTTAKSASRSLSSEFLESFAKNSGHLGENMFWHYVATRMIYCRCTNRIKSLCMSHHVAIEMYKLSKIAMARRWGAPEGNATSPSASQGVSNESWLGVTR